jgi:hypothetical protein
MKKIFTLVLSALLISTVFAQKPKGVVAKTEVKPTIDGVLDASIWDKATIYNVETPFNGETPTLGAPGETNWRAMWDADGIYVFIKVTDDVFVPKLSNTGAAYKYDFPEICFDVNGILNDALGPQEGKGHYQIASKFETELDETGVPKTGTDGVITAFLVDGTNYNAEYFIPYSKLLNMDGGRFDKTQEIGFDVYVVDNDNTSDLNAPVRNRAVWVNDGSVTEAWDNMDNCGIIVLEGATESILMEEINLTAPEQSIAVDRQTLQLGIQVLPLNADDKTVKWNVTREDGSPARATISPEGLITPLVDEVITIQATSIDGMVNSNKIKITITGQKPTLESLSYIKNGNFNEVDLNGAPLIWQGFEAGTANVVDGVLEFAPYSVRANIYDYKMLQIINVPYALKDLDYMLSFKAWADEARSFQLKIEDSTNGWATYGVSSDATSDGKTYWPASLMTITTEPTVYKLHMNFANMAENCNQNLNWQVGESTVKIYLDSVSLVSVEDLNLIKTAVPVYKKEADIKLYPNPVQTELTISKIAVANSKVSVYNALGQKLMEKTANGTQAKFDVANLLKGMYFVRFSDGSSQKFIKE